MDRIKKIIEDVRKNGDRALVKYTEKFDGVKLRPGDIELSPEEIEEKASQVPKPLAGAISAAAENVRDYAVHEISNLRETEFVKYGVSITGRLIPVESAGIYVPGGRYSYPSTALMCAIPAVQAGVENVIIATPPANITPAVCLAARIAGVSRIFRVGGAQAVAAMALGTKTVPRVDMIAGPGNSFVQRAKMLLHGEGVVGIDMTAGPSEVTLIADEFQDVSVICADLAAQAEHAPDARSFFITWDSGLLEAVRDGVPQELASQIQLILVGNSEEALTEANAISPEHLQIMCEPENMSKMIGSIRNAGTVFLGRFSPVALGDYWAGPSHTLPTGKTARFREGLSVRSFLKNVAFITASQGGLTGAAEDIIRIAEEEGMKYHALSVKRRVL